MAETQKDGVLILAAGVKGAIGSTLAAAVCALRQNPELVLPYLMTAQKLPGLGSPAQMALAGWDTSGLSMPEAIAACGVLEERMWAPYAGDLEQVPANSAPSGAAPLRVQVEQIKADISAFTGSFPEKRPVFVNLLPAANMMPELDRFSDIGALCENIGTPAIADLAYVLAALEAGLPVVNFSPNAVEAPAIARAAEQSGLPLAGRDGKTGQTYFKVVLASALRARELFVNGWYSLNILGNADGENLMDPAHAAGKLENKTDVLEDVLGYAPGAARYGRSAHSVRIDYYPPRGDAKEAWDVVDFESIFGLPMSLRINLQGRDSVLAAPLVLDLARWTAAARMAGRGGLMPELDFYFKKSPGPGGAAGFAAQIAALRDLEEWINSRTEGVR